MSIILDYPGVYIEELPRGTHPVTGGLGLAGASRADQAGAGDDAVADTAGASDDAGVDAAAGDAAEAGDAAGDTAAQAAGEKAEAAPPIKVRRGMLQLKSRYSWTAIRGDSPRARKIDATLFSRREGYEVVYMMQKIVNHMKYTQESDVWRIEALIADELPGNVRGQKKVFAWLTERLPAAGVAPATAKKAVVKTAAKKAALKPAAGKKAARARAAARKAAARKKFVVKRAMLENKYSWAATGRDDPKARKTDAVFLNRREGYEVVPMIQKVVDHFGFTSEDDVRKIEVAISGRLPGRIRSRKKVFAWLVEHLS